MFLFFFSPIIPGLTLHMSVAICSTQYSLSLTYVLYVTACACIIQKEEKEHTEATEGGLVITYVSRQLFKVCQRPLALAGSTVIKQQCASFSLICLESASAYSSFFCQWLCILQSHTHKHMHKLCSLPCCYLDTYFDILVHSFA